MLLFNCITYHLRHHTRVYLYTYVEASCVYDRQSVVRNTCASQSSASSNSVPMSSSAGTSVVGTGLPATSLSAAASVSQSYVHENSKTYAVLNNCRRNSTALVHCHSDKLPRLQTTNSAVPLVTYVTVLTGSLS